MPLFMDTIERNGFWQLASRFMVCGGVANVVDEGWLSIQCCASSALPTCRSQRMLWRRGTTALILLTVLMKSELLQSRLSEWMEEHSYVRTGPGSELQAGSPSLCRWKRTCNGAQAGNPSLCRKGLAFREQFQHYKTQSVWCFQTNRHCNSFVTNILVSTSKRQTSKLASDIPQPLR